MRAAVVVVVLVLVIGAVAVAMAAPTAPVGLGAGVTIARGELSVHGVFSHAKHAGRARCAGCHTAAPDPETKIAAAPTMASCAAARCHDGKAAFAVTASCTRCHREPEAASSAASDFKVERPTARYAHAQHAQVALPCAACHPLTAGGEVVTVGHAPCATCHADDFARRKPKTCGACHNGTEPWRALVADRGPPERTEFGAALDHAAHPAACAGCHALTTPASQLRPPRGHRACTGAACHAVQGGAAPQLGQCERCHRAGLAAERQAARLAAPWSVRATFDHASHARTGAIACETCHVALSGSGLARLAHAAQVDVRAVPRRQGGVQADRHGLHAVSSRGGHRRGHRRGHGRGHMTDEPMSRGQRAYVLAMCALIGGAFAYAACDWGHWPHVIYEPLSGRLVTQPTKAISIHYFGLILWGIGGACTGAIVGAVLCSIAPRPWPRRVYQLFGAWALTALLLAGCYFTWNLWPW